MKGFRKNSSKSLGKSDISMAKGTQGGTQGDPRGTQRKTEETKKDARRSKREPGSQMYQKCDTVGKNKGDPKGPKGDPMTPKGEPRGSKEGKSGLAHFVKKSFFAKVESGLASRRNLQQQKTNPEPPCSLCSETPEKVKNITFTK